MNAGATSERVYESLKRRILTREFRPGDRLDPTILAGSLNSSVTPVRDALHKLIGAKLVATRISEGFHLPPVDVPGLQDLYAWNAELLILAMRSWRPILAPDQQPLGRLGGPIASEALADATDRLFDHIGRQSINIEHRAALRSSSDRLHAARLAEAKLLPGISEELHALHGAVEQGETATLRSLIAAYHRRRRRAADEIVRILYRNGGRR